MLGEQFYTWLRQATAEDLQRAREAIQFEIEMREQQQRMAYERHWREFPLPCIHVCQREGCQRLCSHQSNQITPIVKSSTKPQENTIARFITWIVDRCMQYYKKTSASGFPGVLFLLSVNRNPHCGMVCVGPPKFQGNKVVSNCAFNAGGARNFLESCTNEDAPVGL